MLRAKTSSARNTIAKRERMYYSVFVYGNDQLRRMAEQLAFSGDKARALDLLKQLPRITNPNLDVVPGVTHIVKQAARTAGVKIKRIRQQCPKLAAYAEGRCDATRGGLLQVVSQIREYGASPETAHDDLNLLTRLACSDVYWDEVVDVETQASSGPWVYDLSITGTRNFVAGNIIVHNSNVADAIRWALGEQQFSLLRGKKTDDMIFSGSAKRPRASMAEVIMTFDNGDGFFPIEFSEIALGRRAYRDGTNEYLLNGNRVRLRDITDLLGHTGLAERTYTVIGQGLVDSALSQRPEERRALFEEAAGIAAYRNRRDDALAKLEETRHNLERVRDILTEIAPRLQLLERQSERARRYQVLAVELAGHTRCGSAIITAPSGRRSPNPSSNATPPRRGWMPRAQRCAIFDDDIAALRSRQADLRARIGEAEPAAPKPAATSTRSTATWP